MEPAGTRGRSARAATHAAATDAAAEQFSSGKKFVQESAGAQTRLEPSASVRD